MVEKLKEHGVCPAALLKVCQASFILRIVSDHLLIFSRKRDLPQVSPVPCRVIANLDIYPINGRWGIMEEINRITNEELVFLS